MIRLRLFAAVPARMGPKEETLTLPVNWRREHVALLTSDRFHEGQINLELECRLAKLTHGTQAAWTRDLPGIGLSKRLKSGMLTSIMSTYLSDLVSSGWQEADFACWELSLQCAWPDHVLSRSPLSTCPFWW